MQTHKRSSLVLLLRSYKFRLGTLLGTASLVSRLAAADIGILGENTWNQITGAEIENLEGRSGGSLNFVRLHLGDQITEGKYKAVMAWLKKPAKPTNRKALRNVVAKMYSKDHPCAVYALAEAISDNKAGNWKFMVTYDANANSHSPIWHLDVSTDGEIAESEVEDVQKYLDGHMDGPGKLILKRVFWDKRSDEAAAIILDLDVNRITSNAAEMFGENTWNQITGATIDSPNGSATSPINFVRLHLGDQITQKQYNAVMKWRKGFNLVDRKAVQEIVANMKTKDHANALVALARAIGEDKAKNWKFIPTYDANADGRNWHLDVLTDATIAESEVPSVQKYLNGHQNRLGKIIVKRVFWDDGSDEAAAIILDLGVF